MAFNCLYFISTVILFGHCSGHMDIEPKCSQFEFQEKLLEKIVRLELSSELLKAEVATANDEIRKTKEELVELKGMFKVSMVLQYEHFK